MPCCESGLLSAILAYSVVRNRYKYEQIFQLGHDHCGRPRRLHIVAEAPHFATRHIPYVELAFVVGVGVETDDVGERDEGSSGGGIAFELLWKYSYTT